MIERRLLRQLEYVASRFRRLRFWQALAVAWLVTAIGGGLVWGLNWKTGWHLDQAALIFSGVAILLAVAGVWLAAHSTRNYHWVARQIEARHPELRSSLLTAIELRPDLPHGRFGFLQENVIHEALYHGYKNTWRQVVPTCRLVAAFAANLATFALLVFVLAGLELYAAPRAASVEAAADAALVAAADSLSVTVEPGDTEVEKGTSLLVLARILGSQSAEATLLYTGQSPAEVPPGPLNAKAVTTAEATVADAPADVQATRLPMTKSLDDPVFGGRIPAINAPLEYQVELPGYQSESYRVTVFEYPQLVRGDARLVYPNYTGLEERLIQDVRTITAVEGTEVTLICHLNKRVATAMLTEEGAEPLPLVANSGDAIYQVTFRCERSQRLELQLIDQEGRKNTRRARFVINVLPNKPPDLKLVFPARDIQVSPLEETDVRATVWDDFGLPAVGLTYALAGQASRDIVLSQNAAARQRHELSHVISLEDLDAQPDQLLSYYFWAEDIGPDGESRRTWSDMYFAEVRPFEEIFRQGEQPPGGQSQQQQQQQQGGQNAQQAEQLADLQKQIINATWNLIRRETGSEPSRPFASDAALVHESQQSALQQATDLAEQLTDPQSQAHAADVVRSMGEAIDALQAANDGPLVAPLRPALAAEQAAYQGLLRLRAREHNVIRGEQQRQQGQSATGSSSRSQQQLQQLQLSNDENRYETQRTAEARSQQELQDRETRQVLNRLGELARRQNDLNERLKELQSALEQAQSEEQRDEIRRQLSRLTEEQQQILRDTDDLRGRMDAPENQERMADERQQLDETREQVRRAAEALEQESVTQAAAAGTRAERDFQELREEFRRRASDRFSDEMREMRDTARELDQRERQLAEQLSPRAVPEPSRSLRDDDDQPEGLPEQLREQRQRLEELLERVRETTLEAEQSEPLLSDQLHETVRNAQQRDVQRALQAAELSVRRGLMEDARQQERRAREGIGELREGIERAAESVLGDQTEALRRARQQLDRLASELNDELARNTGSHAPNGNEPTEDQNEGGRSDSSQEPSDGEADTQAGRGEREAEEGASPRAASGEASDQRSAESDRGSNEERPQGEASGESAGGQPGRDGSKRSEEAPPSSAGERTAPSQGGERSDSPRGGRRLSDPEGQTNEASDLRLGPGGFEPFEGTEQLAAPLTGEGFLEWSDRLRDVEEMVDDPQLRAEASRIRERARDIRIDIRRHSKLPNWDLVRVEVSEPLVELRNRVAEELLRRTSRDAVVPLDRDPVPPKYSEKTRRYYERLGIGQ